MRYLRRLWFYLTRKSNFNEVKDKIIPFRTRVSAMPWYSVRYEGMVGVTYTMFCEGTDGQVLMGIPLEKMYNIEILK
jgi:hypothetical protein